MWRASASGSARTLLLGLAMGACGGGDAFVRPAAAESSAVRFDQLDAEAWTFSRAITGQAPRTCARIAITNGATRVRAPVHDGRFGVVMPLAPGENVLEARCESPRETGAPSRLRLTVRLRDAPRAVAQTGIIDGALVLLGGQSRPNEATGAALVQRRWRSDPSSPEPLRVAGGAPLDGADGERVPLATPTQDGEYVAWLHVTDARGRDDVAGTYFVVEHGEPRVVDVARESARWVHEAIVYGVAPHLFGDDPFAALADHLPRLSALGVTVLWLGPIFASPPGDYGYAVTDYFTLREDFGPLEHLAALVSAAHRSGVRVILDFVPNHTAREHRYFAHASRHGERSAYYDFYDREADGTPTHYFDWEHLPNLDYDHPEVRRFMREAFAYWVRELDVDGFRVDVAWGVADRAPSFFAELREELTRIEPRLLLLAEASARREVYFHGGFDLAYDWTWDVGEWAWADVFEGERADLRALHQALTLEGEGLPDDARVFRFLDNNDTGTRFPTDHGAGLERSAASLLFTLPGVPSLFTGQAVGAEYEPYQREEPLAFAPDPERTALYAALARLRHEEPALTRGRFVPLAAEPAESVYAFLRDPEEGRAVVVAINFTGASTRATIPLPPALRSEPVVLVPGAGVAPRRRGASLEVPLEPWSSSVLAFAE